jgi:hypothetical protein
MPVSGIAASPWDDGFGRVWFKQCECEAVAETFHIQVVKEDHATYCINSLNVPACTKCHAEWSRSGDGK